MVITQLSAEGAEDPQKTQNKPSRDVLLRLLRHFCAFCVRKS
jgi:hypothetical protein